MIDLHEGKVGSGKSYHAVHRMLERVARGGHVSSNILLKWLAVCDYIENTYGVRPKKEQYQYLEELSDFHEKTPSGSDELPSLIVIDETAIDFESRNWRENAEKAGETFKWLVQSRKDNTDVIFISQHRDTVDVQFRRQFTDVIVHRFFANYKLFGFRLFAWFPFIVGFHMGAKSTAQSRPEDRTWLRMSPKGVGSCYDTRQKHSSFKRAGSFEKLDLEETPGRKSRKARVFSSLLVGIILLLWVFKGCLEEDPSDGRTVAGFKIPGSGVPSPSIAAPSQDKSPAVKTLDGVEVRKAIPMAAFPPGMGRDGQEVSPMTGEPFSPPSHNAWVALEPYRSSGLVDGIPYVSTAFEFYQPGRNLAEGLCVRVDPYGKWARIKLRSGGFLIVHAVDDLRHRKALSYQRQWERWVVGEAEPIEPAESDSPDEVSRLGSGSSSPSADAPEMLRKSFNVKSAHSREAASTD